MEGILMKPWKTKAIAEGGTDRLWQTRRIIKPQPNGGLFWGCVGGKGFGFFDRESNKYKPRYKVGDTVYIKEALYRHPYFNEAGYLRDESPVFVNQTIGDMLKWRWKRDIFTGMFMPQEAARVFITILDVRAEKLYLPLSPEEFELEGGDQALPLLKLIDDKWVFVYTLKLKEAK